MTSSHADCTLTIDLKAICQNYHTLSALSGEHTQTAAVVKADAYGCGVEQVAPALYETGVRIFYVAQLDEAIKLTAIVPNDASVFYFNGNHAEEAFYYNAIPVINTPKQLEAIGEGQKFALHANSGITRLGFEVLPEISKSMACVKILSHLACSDEPENPYNEQQRLKFIEQTQCFNVPRSLSATGGILLGEAYHFDEVRPGIGLYGCAPFAEAKPVATLVAPILQIRTIQKGTPVGYGTSWTAERETRVATLPLGYADGIVRSASNKGFVFAEGKRLPVIGRISMDLITIDATETTLEEGDSVEIFGKTIKIDEWATHAGTIGYEFLTSLGTRYQREYIGG
jgi:alanine racemase